MNKLKYFEYRFYCQSDYIAAYSEQQADMIYAQEILSKSNDDQRETFRYLVSDEKIKELGLNKEEPGICLTKEKALKILEECVIFASKQNDCSTDSGATWQSKALEDEIWNYNRAFGYIKGLILNEI